MHRLAILVCLLEMEEVMGGRNGSCFGVTDPSSLRESSFRPRRAGDSDSQQLRELEQAAKHKKIRLRKKERKRRKK